MSKPVIPGRKPLPQDYPATEHGQRKKFLFDRTQDLLDRKEVEDSAEGEGIAEIEYDQYWDDILNHGE